MFRLYCGNGSISFSFPVCIVFEQTSSKWCFFGTLLHNLLPRCNQIKKSLKYSIKDTSSTNKLGSRCIYSTARYNYISLVDTLFYQHCTLLAKEELVWWLLARLFALGVADHREILTIHIPIHYSIFCLLASFSRSCWPSKSISGPTATIPYGLMFRWLCYNCIIYLKWKIYC